MRNSARPRPLSILYTPHGVLASYVNNHLRSLSALLPSRAFPGISAETSCAEPVVASYLPHSLKSNVWLSSHDEDKINKGFWVRKFKNERRSVKEVGKMLCPDQNSRRSRSGSECARSKRDGRWVCETMELAPGESKIIASDTMALPEGAGQGVWL
jgi:hypothetical protein